MMMKNLKEMTWGMHAFYLFMFALGVIPLIVFVIHHDNPNLGGDPLLLFIPAGGLMGGAVLSFLMCLFEKRPAQHNLNTLQQKKDNQLTATR